MESVVEENPVSSRYVAALNPNSTTHSQQSSGHFGKTNRTIIAAIVYFALLFDNVLLTVIVPILPDYLATLNNETHYVHVNSVNLAGGVSFGTSYAANNLAFGHINETMHHQFQHQKHPIPALKIKRNISAIQPLESDTYSPNLTSENGSIGILLAMKALVQLMCNPIVGNISSKYGYRLPIVVGTFCLLAAAFVFAVGESYWALLLARAIQGIGSACIGVCGMSLVAQHYPEEERRSKVMGVILGSIALGVLIGYPFGSILYDCIGKSAPFIVLVFIISINLVIQLFVMDLTIKNEVSSNTEDQQNQPQHETQNKNWRQLLESRMILGIVIAIWFSTSTMAILEPCLPIWLIEHIHPTKWQLGTVFIPDSMGYFMGTNFFGSIAYNFGQIKISCISLILVGISSILIPSSTTVFQLLMPHFVLGLGIGIIDAALVPLLATYVDSLLTCDDEHCENDSGNNLSSYGTVYAIQQTSVSLAYCLAPLLGGELAQVFGFPALMRIVGVVNIIYGPILVYLYQKYDPKIIREQRNELSLTSAIRTGSQYRQFYNSVDLE